jgi:hypothetical protein
MRQGSPSAAESQRSTSRFIAPEAYNCLLEYRVRREAAGEVITKDSPLIRDAWDSNKYRKYKRQNASKSKASVLKGDRKLDGCIAEEDWKQGSSEVRFQADPRLQKILRNECWKGTEASSM